MSFEPNNQVRALALLLLLVLLTGAGLGYLMHLRFQGGTVYPPYSSFRTDPLGTKALFETLNALPGIRVRRAFRSTEHAARAPRNALVLVVGLSMANTAELRRFGMYSGWTPAAALGNRLVLALRPDRIIQPTPAAGPPGGGRCKPETPQDQTPPPNPLRQANRELRKIWTGLDLVPGPPVDTTSSARNPAVRRLAAPSGFPPELPWHCRAYFRLKGAARKRWTPWYGWDAKRPVIIRCRIGRGDLVLATDSYLFSNEALAKKQSARFLLGLLDAKRRVLFDETHFGILESPNLMVFLRRHRLLPAAAALVLAGLLYLWQALARPLPPSAEAAPVQAEDWIAAHSAAAGLAQLMRRHLSPAAAVEHCVRECLAAAPKAPALRRELADALDARLARELAKPARYQDWVGCYNDIQTLLEHRRSSAQPGSTPP